MNNQVQSPLFDNMREIHKQRPQIERRQHQQIAQNFSKFSEGKRKPHSSDNALEAQQQLMTPGIFRLCTGNCCMQ